MKYYLIVGEKSGDLHGSNLMKGIQKEDPEADFRFWGGDDMQAVGGTLVKHYRETAYMGFLEVVKNLRNISKLIKACQKDILENLPDVLILVDYGGFNLRIAKFMKKNCPQVPIYYYISPKVWAWNTKRAWKIKARVDRMFVIFPFEVDFFRNYDYKVDYVGNPLMDAIAQHQGNPGFREKNNLSDKPIIALLPGSRQQEVAKILTKMLVVQDAFPQYQFVVAGVSSLDKALYQAFEDQEKVRVVFDQTYDLLSAAEAGMITSGTATLETALLGLPQVVVYQTSWISYQLAKYLIKIRYISLVNLILDKEAVRELIQHSFNPQNLKEELSLIIKGGAKRPVIQRDYEILREKVGGPGASEKTGRMMVNYLQKEVPPSENREK